MNDDTNTKQRPIGEAFFHGMPRAPYAVDETDTQTRFFPKMVKLTLPDHTQRIFQIGIQEVPSALADHPWLVANGMKEISALRPLPPLMRTAPVGSQGYGTAIMQSGVYDATLIPNARVTDEVLKNAHEFATMAQKGVQVAQDNLEHAVDVMKAAQANLEEAVARRQERDRVDPVSDDDEHDTMTAAQRQSLAKSRVENESKLGLDLLSDEDRAKFDSLNGRDKAKYLGLPPDERAVMLAGAGK